MQDYFFDHADRFVLRNYHQKPAFASFLPGIAGLLGIPLWVFYVNRGQAVASVGVESKDVPIVEFQPANKAYQAVGATGFRTFIKLASAPSDGAAGGYYEPFGSVLPDATGCVREMAIGMNELRLVEESAAHGLRVAVDYFTLTNEPFSGLVRQVSITNTGAAERQLSVMDGLPVIAPYGLNDPLLKHMARTAEAWMGVGSVAEDVPFYRVRSSIGDEVEIESYQAGHFYVAFDDAGERLPALVDPAILFGENTSLSTPDRFLQGDLDALYAQPQITLGRTPCGFFGAARALAPGETWTINSIIGHVASIDVIQDHLKRISQPAYVADQFTQARELALDLTEAVAITTSQPRLDAYTRQTFLDNVLRGGWPVVLQGGEQQFVQHVYSRKHGDLERDYNAFFLAAEYYSQGNGNYRDVNQNRREDVWLNPAVGDYNVHTFMNLLQADGYNPLVVRGNEYHVPAARRAGLLAWVDQPDALAPVLAESFTPGSLLKALAVRGIGLTVTPEAFLAQVMAVAEQRFVAEFGEGYWVDHWTYNLDLIENYLAIYPERKQELLFAQREYTFYDSSAVVMPRCEKHVLVDGVVRQLGAVRHDAEKEALIAARAEYPHVARAEHGQGAIFRTTLIAKLVCLAAIKCATPDPAGMGIEMEANKPGWYDALNGLPGLFGSSLPEAFELIRLLRFIRAALAEAPTAQLDLPEETSALLVALATALATYERDSSADRDFVFWEAAATARENCRAATRLGFSGVEQEYPVEALAGLLARLEARLSAGVERAASLNDGIPPTYLRFEATGYELLDGQSTDVDARQRVRVTGFAPIMLPLFLEGPVRNLVIEADGARALALHERVKASPLYDRDLGMYKVNASLDGEPFDIGRARAFPPGWLENESIWLHMAYKYLLALLKAGLYAAFYAEVRQVLIPFQPPERYGRSPLENSSFIVSSAHVDPSLHGRGFVARLSGSTAEYLSILHRLLFGPAPFVQQDGELALRFAPVLADWLFADDGVLDCTFLGQVKVRYVNPTRGDTFGPDGVEPARVVLRLPDDERVEFAGAVIPAPYAARIRQREITQITVHLA